ncbi:MAG: DMT family transporter [Pseudomonadota bacterium]
MTPVWAMVLSAAIGLALSMQPAVNSATASVLTSAPAAATLSLTLSALLVLALFFATGAPSTVSQLTNLPWWSVLGGIIGAIFVAGSTFLIPINGAAVFFVCLIAGQLAGAVLIDAAGAFGLMQQTISLKKVAGLALAFAGVMLVRWG